MIGKDVALAAHLVDGFKALIGYDNLPPNQTAEVDELAASALHPRFPGALLVWPRKDKPAVYYAVAADGAEWRRLRPLLIAYVGPTLTTFTGWPEPLLPQKVPVEAYLAGGNWHTVARLVPGPTPKIQEMTRRSMSRMLSMMAQAPTTSQSAPRSTSGMLSMFAERLNGNDYAGAVEILDACRAELRLDALNLLFLRVRLLAHFKNWFAIVNMPQFASLCQTRKPPLITATLLEAIYHVDIAKGEVDVTVSSLMAEWSDEVQARVRPLLKLPIPAGSGPGALRVYALEALSLQQRNTELERSVLQHKDALGPLGDALVSVGRTGALEVTTAVEVARDPLADAQSAMVVAESANTLASIADAFLKIKELDEEARRQLLSSSMFKFLFDAMVSESGGSSPPTNWLQWMNRLSDAEFTSAQDVLRRAVDEWPASDLVDPTEINRFAEHLANIPDTPPANDRIADAIPWLVKWASADPQFPRDGILPIYETLLFHLMVGMRRGTAVFESAAVLIRALLEIGLSSKAYEALLDDCLMLLGDGMGQRTVYWLLDILEETVQNTCPSPARRQAFWYACHERLREVQTYLTPGQKLSFERLAVSLGWPSFPAEGVAPQPGDNRTEILRVELESKNIAIYTLTESAARQAETALKAIAPEVIVSISCDAVGTPSLKSMAQAADIFVVVTASAKHAATTFIQQIRPKEKPLLFANGRGFTSIVRAVEEHVLGADR